MIEVIDFFFEILSKVWNAITSYWLLGASFLILVLGFVVDLVKQSKEQ